MYYSFLFGLPVALLSLTLFFLHGPMTVRSLTRAAENPNRLTRLFLGEYML